MKTIKAFFKNMISFRENERMKIKNEEMKKKIEILMNDINEVNFERLELKEENEKLKSKYQ